MKTYTPEMPCPIKCLADMEPVMDGLIADVRGAKEIWEGSRGGRYEVIIFTDAPLSRNKREAMYPGLRWQDLKRWGNDDQVMSYMAGFISRLLSRDEATNNDLVADE